MTLAQQRDRTKYIVFADYNGLMFPVGRVGTIKAANDLAEKEVKARAAGLALTMRIFQQIDHIRHNKYGEKV